MSLRKRILMVEQLQGHSPCASYFILGRHKYGTFYCAAIVESILLCLYSKIQIYSGKFLPFNPEQQLASVKEPFAIFVAAYKGRWFGKQELDERLPTLLSYFKWASKSSCFCTRSFKLEHSAQRDVIKRCLNGLNSCRRVPGHQEKRSENSVWNSQERISGSRRRIVRNWVHIASAWLQPCMPPGAGRNLE